MGSLQGLPRMANKQHSALPGRGVASARKSATETLRDDFCLTDPGLWMDGNIQAEKLPEQPADKNDLTTNWAWVKKTMDSLRRGGAISDISLAKNTSSSTPNTRRTQQRGDMRNFFPLSHVDGHDEEYEPALIQSPAPSVGQRLDRSISPPSVGQPDFRASHPPSVEQPQNKGRPWAWDHWPNQNPTSSVESPEPGSSFGPPMTSGPANHAPPPGSAYQQVIPCLGLGLDAFPGFPLVSRHSPVSDNNFPQSREAVADRPLITTSTLGFEHDGTYYIEPRCLKGVPLARIEPQDPYWDQTWRRDLPSVWRTELIGLESKETAAEVDLQVAGSSSDMVAISRAASEVSDIRKRRVQGEAALHLLEEGPIHPYQLLSKEYMCDCILDWPTLHRLASILGELARLCEAGTILDQPVDWIRYRLHDLITSAEKGKQKENSIHDSTPGKPYLPLMIWTICLDKKLAGMRAKVGMEMLGLLSPPQRLSEHDLVCNGHQQPVLEDAAACKRPDTARPATSSGERESEEPLFVGNPDSWQPLMREETVPLSNYNFSPVQTSRYKPGLLEHSKRPAMEMYQATSAGRSSATPAPNAQGQPWPAAHTWMPTPESSQEAHSAPMAVMDKPLSAFVREPSNLTDIIRTATARASHFSARGWQTDGITSPSERAISVTGTSPQAPIHVRDATPAALPQLPSGLGQSLTSSKRAIVANLRDSEADLANLMRTSFHSETSAAPSRSALEDAQDGMRRIAEKAQAEGVSRIPEGQRFLQQLEKQSERIGVKLEKRPEATVFMPELVPQMFKSLGIPEDSETLRSIESAEPSTGQLDRHSEVPISQLMMAEDLYGNAWSTAGQSSAPVPELLNGSRETTRIAETAAPGSSATPTIKTRPPNPFFTASTPARMAMIQASMPINRHVTLSLGGTPMPADDEVDDFITAAAAVAVKREEPGPETSIQANTEEIRRVELEDAERRIQEAKRRADDSERRAEKSERRAQNAEAKLDQIIIKLEEVATRAEAAARHDESALTSVASQPRTTSSARQGRKSLNDIDCYPVSEVPRPKVPVGFIAPAPKPAKTPAKASGKASGKTSGKMSGKAPVNTPVPLPVLPNWPKASKKKVQPPVKSSDEESSSAEDEVGSTSGSSARKSSPPSDVESEMAPQKKQKKGKRKRIREETSDDESEASSSILSSTSIDDESAGPPKKKGKKRAREDSVLSDTFSNAESVLSPKKKKKGKKRAREVSVLSDTFSDTESVFSPKKKKNGKRKRPRWQSEASSPKLFDSSSDTESVSPPKKKGKKSTSEKIDNKALTTSRAPSDTKSVAPLKTKKKRRASEEVADEEDPTPSKTESVTPKTKKKRRASEEVADEEDPTPSKTESAAPKTKKKKLASAKTTSEEAPTPDNTKSIAPPKTNKKQKRAIEKGADEEDPTPSRAESAAPKTKKKKKQSHESISEELAVVESSVKTPSNANPTHAGWTPINLGWTVTPSNQAPSESLKQSSKKRSFERINQEVEVEKGNGVVSTPEPIVDVPKKKKRSRKQTEDDAATQAVPTSEPCVIDLTQSDTPCNVESSEPPKKKTKKKKATSKLIKEEPDAEKDVATAPAVPKTIPSVVDLTQCDTPLTPEPSQPPKAKKKKKKTPRPAQEVAVEGSSKKKPPSNSATVVSTEPKIKEEENLEATRTLPLSRWHHLLQHTATDLSYGEYTDDLSYEDFTDIDESSRARLFPTDWPLVHVKSRLYRCAEATQAWCFDEEEQYFRHQVLKPPAGPGKKCEWALLDEPISFGFALKDVTCIKWSPDSLKVGMHIRSNGHMEEDGRPRGVLHVEFPRERTKKRFIVFCQLKMSELHPGRSRDSMFKIMPLDMLERWWKNLGTPLQPGSKNTITTELGGGQSKANGQARIQNQARGHSQVPAQHQARNQNQVSPQKQTQAQGQARAKSQVPAQGQVRNQNQVRGQSQAQSQGQAQGERHRSPWKWQHEQEEKEMQLRAREERERSRLE